MNLKIDHKNEKHSIEKLYRARRYLIETSAREASLSLNQIIGMQKAENIIAKIQLNLGAA